MVLEKPEFQAVVLAGGRGSRMPELTGYIPKALIPVANQPLICYPLHWLSTAGIDEVIIVVLESQKKEIQEALAANFPANRLRLSYAVIPADDSDFDTADALRLVADRIVSNFLVVSCDFISNLPLGRVLDVFRTGDASMVACFVPNLATGSKDVTVNVAGPKTKRQVEKEILMYDEESMRLVRSFAEAELDEEGMQLTWKILQRFPCVRTRSTFSDARVYVFKRWVIDYVSHDEIKKTVSSLTDDLKPKLLRRQFQAFGKLPTEFSHWPPPSMTKPSAEAGGATSSAASINSPVIYLPNIRSPLNRARQHAFLTQQSMMMPPANAVPAATRDPNERTTTKLDILTLADYAPEELLIHSLSIGNPTEKSGLSRLVGESDVIEAAKCYAYLVENNNLGNGGVFAYRVNNLQAYSEVNRLHSKLRTAFAQVAANAVPTTHVPRGHLSSTDSQSASAADYTSIDSGAVVSGPSAGGDSNSVLKKAISVDAGRPQYGSDSLVGEKSTLGDKVVVKKSIIGRNCTIGEKVALSNCIVMDGVTVEKGSILQNCIVVSGAKIAERCELKDCIVGFGVEVRAGNKVTNEAILPAADDDDENDI